VNTEGIGIWSRVPVSVAAWESLVEQKRYLNWAAAQCLGHTELRDWYSVKPDRFRRIINGMQPARI
jgi:hypothetical protein